MQIPLSDFEQYIDDVILSRGLNYFQSGRIIEFNETRPGEIDAIVRGSEDYFVNLKIKNGIVLEHHCDCPFEYGEVCKHIAAVIFHIQQDELEFLLDDGKPKKTKAPAKTKVRPTAKPKPDKKPKKKSFKDQVEELIDIVRYPEMIEFIKDIAANNTVFRDSLLAKFADEYHVESIEVYATQIRMIASQTFSFNNWSKPEELVSFLKELSPYFEKAHIKRETEGINSAFIVAYPILENLVETAKLHFYTIDENLINAINECTALLSETKEDKFESKYKRQLYSLGLKTFKANKTSDINRATLLLSFAIDNIQTENDYLKIVAELDKYNPNSSNYGAIQVMTYKLIKAYNCEEDALKYLESKLAVYSMLKVYLDILISEGKIQEAIERINFYIKNHIVRDSYSKKIYDDKQNVEIHEKLLELYRSINDVKMIVKIAEYLLELTINMEYTDIIKSVLTPSEWETYYIKYISKRSEAKFVCFSTIIVKLLIQEEQFDRLFEYLKKHANMRNLEEIDEILFEKFPEETAALYYKKISEYLKSNKDRNTNDNVVYYIKGIMKLGYREHACMIIEQLKSEFHKIHSLTSMLDSIRW